MRSFLLLFVLTGAIQLAAQVTPPRDTTLTTDLQVKQAETLVLSKPARVYVPKKALLWSIAPGGGQIYNRRWWKLPIVYGAFAGMIGIADFNQTNFNRFQRALESECFGVQDPDCVPSTHEFTGLFDVNALRSLRDSYDRNRQLAYLGIFVVYLLQGVEAFVDAHLRTFDIEDDIGFRIEPQYYPEPGVPVGVSIVIPIRQSSGR